MSSDSESESLCNENESLSQKIIVEVQKRPALYDKTIRQYSDRTIKSKLWTEVYAKVVHDWMNLTEDEKVKKGNIIQKKCKNMRDCFAKELAMQCGKSGQSSIKKRKYVHFDSLLFLVPSLQKRETTSNITAPPRDNANIEEVENIPIVINRPSNCKKILQSQKNNDVYEQKLLEYLNSKENDYDDDISFSRMIVPLLRKLNDDQKHYAKIEIMNILQKAKSFHASAAPIAMSQSLQSQSFKTCSLSPSTTLHSQVPKLKIVKQEIISPPYRGPAKQTITLSHPSTSKQANYSIPDYEEEEITAADYISNFQ